MTIKNKPYKVTVDKDKPSKLSELQDNLLTELFRRKFDELTINDFIFKVCYDNDKLKAANIHYHKIINRLSRKIQKKNKEINQLFIAVDSLKRCINIKTNYNCELIDRIYKALEYMDIQFDNNGIIHYELTKILKGSDNNER